jgi:anaerobic selenocysteine-containing dehydrogenase
MDGASTIGPSTGCGNSTRPGVECVNISPMRSDAADLLNADWLTVRPNIDTALMLGLAHTQLVEGRHDEAFLTRYCVLDRRHMLCIAMRAARGYHVLLYRTTRLLRREDGRAATSGFDSTRPPDQGP